MKNANGKGKTVRRSSSVKKRELRLPAIRVDQGENRQLFSFAVDGKFLPEFVTISRIRRESSGDIGGYQRPEIRSHISDIRRYLESPDPMIPNAIVIAFDDRVAFEPADREAKDGEFSTIGELVIPIDPALADEEKPGWVVDGQQRLAAIRDAKLESFPICVVAFVAEDTEEQREQFILVNSTKPLPKGLIYELLPSTSTHLPELLERKRFPSTLLARLNSDSESPLYKQVKTPTNPDGVIKDNSVLRMLGNSLTDGVLYRFNDVAEGPDMDSMVTVLNRFWRAVSQVFPSAWAKPPRKSRLMHGAGIVSMGFLMDAISDRQRGNGIPSENSFKEDLMPLRDVCRWTDGFWDLGPGRQIRWNEIQNTSKDVQLLSNYLLIQYKQRVWSRSESAVA